MNDSGSKNDLKKATCHKFLGWGASTQMVHYLDSQSDTIKRARHVYFDDFSSATPIDKLSPGGILLRNETAPPPVTPNSDTQSKNNSDKDAFPVFVDPDSKRGISSASNIPSPVFDINVINFHLAPPPSPFNENTTHTYKVNLSNSKTRPFGIFVQYDEIPTSPWYINLPVKFRRNVWILGINST